MGIAVVSLLIGTSVADDGGNPFDALWDAFFGLESRVEALEEQHVGTRYYSIPGSAWQPVKGYYDYVRGEFTYTTTAGITGWYASVNLPHGAVVTEFTAWVYDNDTTEDIDVGLYRHIEEAFWAVAEIISSGSSPSLVQYTDDLISYPTIDNQNYAYLLWGNLRSGDDNHRLAQVRITYTIDETLP